MWTWPGRIQRVLAHRWFGRVAVAGLAAAVLLWGWGFLRPDEGHAAISWEARRLQGAGSSEWARMIDATARWWLAELWLELGDRDRAAVYFQSMWRDPAAADRLSELLALESLARSSVAGR